jgi:hypothetical protein
MDILTNFKAALFESNEVKFDPIIPIRDFMDVELGGDNVHLPMNVYDNLEIKNDKLDNPDLELGFGPIVELTNKHIIIRVQTLKNNHKIENYYSLFDSLNYINTNFNNSKNSNSKHINANSGDSYYLNVPANYDKSNAKYSNANYINTIFGK